MVSLIATNNYYCGLMALASLLHLDFCDSFSSLSWIWTRTIRGRYDDGEDIIMHKYHHLHGVIHATHVHCRWPRHCLPASSLYMSKSNTDERDTIVRRNERFQIAIDKFISTLLTSIEMGSFESFTLTGPVAPRKGRKSNSEINDSNNTHAEKLRGKYKRIIGRLILLQDKRKKKSSGGTSKKDSANDEKVDPGRLCVQVTIKYFLATDIVKNWEISKQLNSDQTEVEQGLKQLFLTAMGDGIDGPLSEWGSQNISGDVGILAGTLETSDGIYKLRLHPHQHASFERSKTNPPQPNGKLQSLPQLAHDRLKNVALSPSSNFFQKLGVSNADGKPLIGMASKLRQCQKFVEVVGNLLDNGTTPTANSRFRVIDMGCGRGYLTFSLHSYLSSKAEVVQTQGIDQRPKLIEEINGIARELGGEFATLNFIAGTIESAPHNLFDQLLDSESCLDILIALHACDTATDDALWFAITHEVDVIVTAPCCQHELRPQIDRYAATNPDQPLSNILRHAIYRERATETVTDAMRAILLEIAGYESNVFEFVGGEHTAKNVMITATKVTKSKDEKWLQARRQRLIDLAELYGIKYQRLAMLMEERITSGEDDVPTFGTKYRSGMAPL